MTTVVLVTGAAGFVGLNLCSWLEGCADVILLKHDLRAATVPLDESLMRADVVFHLAGVNRPESPEAFQETNVGFTTEICSRLRRAGRKAKVVLASSVQAELENAYGVSKRGAEEAVRRYAAEAGAAAVIYRLKNLFGKWCRPNYNSVTATFCQRIMNDLPIEVRDPEARIQLTHVDEVVRAFAAEVGSRRAPGCRYAEPLASRDISLGELVALIRGFKAARTSGLVSIRGDAFVRALYGMYLSYAEPEDLILHLNADEKADVLSATVVETPDIGRVQLWRLTPGVKRGEERNQTAAARLLVLEGLGIVHVRQLLGEAASSMPVEGREWRVIEVPAGYAFALENSGERDLTAVVWQNEGRDPMQVAYIAEKGSERALGGAATRIEGPNR